MTCGEAQRIEIKQITPYSADNMRRYRIVLLIYFCVGIPAWAQTNTAGTSLEKHIQTEIEHFYSQYLHMLETGESRVSLLHDIFTPEMCDKYYRQVCKLDADPLLGGQDFEQGETYKCRHLDGAWYEVYWREAYSNTIKRIPIRCIIDSLGKTKISHIAPETGKYGDDFIHINVLPVVHKNAFDFLTSFYSNYLAPYIRMSLNLKQDLERIRARYCTEEFLVAHPISRDDEWFCDTDPLIANMGDVDGWSYHALSIKDCGQGWYMINFGLEKVQIRIELVKAKGVYKIANLRYE